MGFVLNTKAIRSLVEIRQEYENEKQVKLNKKPSMIGIPAFFGGTDVEVRSNQIGFIEKMLLVLSDNLITEEQNISSETNLANLTASRMIIAVCLYTQGQITSNCKVLSGKNAFLHQLIDKKLGITASNSLTAEDKAICFESAYALLSIPNAFDEANRKLKKLGMAPIAFSDWNVFKHAVINECLPSKTLKNTNQYPFTSITKPLFGAAFGYTGASLGFLGGEILSKSNQLMPTRYYISAAISGIAFTLQTSNAIGVGILVPLIANRLLETFFQVSLGHIGAVTFKILGEGVGTVVGFPLDVAYHLTSKLYTTLKEIAASQTDRPELSGIRIIDGMPVIHGIVIEIKASIDSINDDTSLCTDTDETQLISIDEHNNIYINQKLVSIKKSKDEKEGEAELESSINSLQ